MRHKLVLWFLLLLAGFLVGFILQYSRNGVVTLTGEVNSQAERDHAEKVATIVPNVKQVVNDLRVKNQKASSSQ